MQVSSCCFLLASGEAFQCSVWRFMWEDPVSLQSYFNTDSQTLHTYNTRKNSRLHLSHQYFPWWSTERQRSHSFAKLCKSRCRQETEFWDIVAVHWLLFMHFPSAFCYIATSTTSVYTKLKNILF